MLLYPLRRLDFSRTTEETQYQIRVEIDGTTEDLLTGFTLDANADWWLSDDGQADDLIELLNSAIETHSVVIGGESLVASLGLTNRLTLAGSIDWSIHWNHANTTLSALPFGFASQADVGASLNLTAPNMVSGTWCPQTSYGTPLVPEVESRPIAQHRTGAAVALSGLQRGSYLGTARPIRNFRWNLLEPHWALSEYALTTEALGTAEDVIASLALARPVRYYEDSSSRTADSYWLARLRAEDQKQSLDAYVTRDEHSRLRWSFQLPLRGAA